MVARERRGTASGVLELAVRLHDASAGLAIGMGLLKGSTEGVPGGQEPSPDLALEAFEQVLGELRQLSASISDRAAHRDRRTSFRESLRRDARVASVELELIVVGQETWLSDDQLELVCLAGREAIRNVKRHSGASQRRVTLDVSACPLVLTVRDWGAGAQPATRVRGGIAFLEALAGRAGAALTIRSQPGLGTELTLTGPRCALAGGGPESNDFEIRSRSVVADESPSSRKTVAGRRPIGARE